MRGDPMRGVAPGDQRGRPQPGRDGRPASGVRDRRATTRSAPTSSRATCSSSRTGRAGRWRTTSRRCSSGDSASRSSSSCGRTASSAAIVDKAPDGFGGDPDTYHSDVVFLKAPLTSRQAMRVVELREGVDQAWPGTGVVYFARLSARRTQSRMSRIVGTPEYQQMTIRSWTHDDEAARPARGRSMTALDAFGPRSWARPEATGFGRLPMSTYLVRPDELALDGTWAFALRDRPEDVTADDLAGPTDGWATIEVPGCWTMQGFDRPQYTNVQMPFPGPPPRVPDDNPTGVYRRTVTVPAVVGGPAHRAARRRGRVGALRPRRRRAGRHGQGLAPPARVRPHRRRRAGPAVRAGAHGRAVVRRDLPRGPGPLVPRRPAPLASSSTRRRRCTSPTCTPSPTTTPPPATAASTSRVRGRRPTATARRAGRRASTRRRTSRRRADVHFEHPTNCGRQLAAASRAAAPTLALDRARTSRRGRAETPVPARPHRHAARRRRAPRSTRCR